MPDRADHPESTGVLFVCLGNICRSPLAEGIFLHQARQRDMLDRFRVDSCGTGAWHAGEPADPRSVAVAAKHGIELPSIARQFDPRRDAAEFDWIIAMDRQNQHNLIKAGAPKDRVRLMMSFHPDPPVEEVPDPYYGGPDGFDKVYEMLRVACEGILDDFA
ncbi:MAG: low molecular weight phosphotyrosine protein phosphatase [Phycisphaerales bacterium]|nr:low molecular weight phosphotyrosine protein phosphatase [Planctomycetota bacterium]MCH8507893.1 low molecular weight phosphotyrosine protein phosphatase [Phycisphaerales bacterium]